MSKIVAQDRILGCIFGTLVGDALGVPVEFLARSTLDNSPVTGMRGGGTWNQLPGTWSDDGAMTLCMTEVLASHGWQPQLMMDGFLRWLDEGWWAARGAAFDVGTTTRDAIRTFRVLRDCTDCGQSDERSNGNGSLMRCAPVSAWLAGATTSERIRLAGEASALTHAHLRSRLSCAWHALWCDAIMSGSDVRSAAARSSLRLSREVPTSERAHLDNILTGSVMDLPREKVRSDGYVISTLEAALWCLANHRGFEDVVLAAVNLGGDTDTTGAVAGGMAGWLLGIHAIPPAWLAALPRRAEVEGVAGRFTDRCLARWASYESR